MARKRTDDLPARVEIHAGSYYYRPGALGRKAGDPRSSIPLGKDRDDAIIRARAIERGLRAVKVLDDRTIRAMLHRARCRAAAQGAPFQLTGEDIAELALEHNGRCAISQLPFSTEKHDDGHRTSPWSVSLDRIHPRRGYVRGNVRLVCNIVNVALNEWGVDVLTRMARAVASARRGAISQNGSRQFTTPEA